MLKNGTIVELIKNEDGEAPYRREDLLGHRGIVVDRRADTGAYLINFGSAYANYKDLHEGLGMAMTKQKRSCWWVQPRFLNNVFGVEEVPSPEELAEEKRKLDENSFKEGDIVVFVCPPETPYEYRIVALNGVRAKVVRVQSSSLIIDFGEAYNGFKDPDYDDKHYRKAGLYTTIFGSACWNVKSNMIKKVK